MSKPTRIEVLAIGNELLDGRVADTNTLHLANVLAEIGFEIAQRTTVIDDVAIIVRAAKEIIARGTTLCVVSGGLGPTSDDLTSLAFATLQGVKLMRDEAWARYLRERFAARGYTLTDNQLTQADRPAGSEAVNNPVGTAPGFALTHEGCRFVSLPGVPAEFERMVEAAVVLPLAPHSRDLQKRELRSFGLIEGEVDRRLSSLAQTCPNVVVGYRAKFPEIHVSLKAQPGFRDELDRALTFTREALADHVFSESKESLAEALVALLRGQRETLALAESCTGGAASDLITDVPGCSDVFVGSVVAYHDAIKRDVLGVPQSVLDADGAVSEATVIAMAAGVRRALRADCGIAISGIAGPTGEAPGKPVGTVWLAIQGEGFERTLKLQLPFDRRRNKVVSAYTGLDLLRRALRKREGASVGPVGRNEGSP